MRAFTAIWDEICRTRYGVQDPSLRRFRYGVQVNSLGLTEQQPENNVHAHRARDARRDAVGRRARAGHPAAGVERGARPAAPVGPAVEPAHPAGPRLRDRPARVPRPLRRLAGHGRRWSRDLADGRASRARRRARPRRRLRRDRGAEEPPRREPGRSASRASSRGEQVVVGVNRFTETAASPLTERRRARAILDRRPGVERELVATSRAWRASRDDARGRRGARRARARRAERRPARQRHGAHASRWPRPGGTTGEWADALREVFGEYRAPTGVRAGAAPRGAAFAALVERSRALVRGARAPAQAPRRQARPRRPLQRRRADRGRRARRRLRGRLPRDPPLARGDRGHRARRGRRRRGHLDPLGLAPRPGAARSSTGCAPPGRRRAGRGRRDRAATTTRRRCAPPACRRSTRPRTSRSRAIIGRTCSTSSRRRRASAGAAGGRRSGPRLNHRPEKRHAGTSSAAGRAAIVAATCSAAATRAAISSSGSVGTRREPVAHSGTFPCLRLGRSSRLPRSRSSDRLRTRRVSAGSMTSSMKPRSAAM